MSDDVLAGVGPRLRELRQRRGSTLADLAAETGISVSTLSRLESGRRRATLELLLPLARAHQVPLDDLVSAPVADPRVRARAFRAHGRTYVPLTRRPGGLQAFKVAIPAPEPVTQGGDEPSLGTHEGYEWCYVLAGRVRLRLGDQDLVLGPGEAAEFDTRLPHALTNPGPGPAEMISLFGPQGERLHVRT